ncbi:hypothetical protein CDD81_7762 [Ophiocordyceps australis]|uniref:Micro-fibrillar-associated protein 1 C-terminal domain-containing protein n=1 Tax=Ophiocordyceps australis TaxID=1399860 RepID=A0A2C5XGM1_9HYPO|nr:hypothetical protein CDD81_7762 [Ophiocordyceps australis]
MPPKQRMTANPARPARHRAGKPTDGGSSSDSDSDDETAPPPRAIAAPPKAASAGKIISSLSHVKLDARHRQVEQAAEQRRRVAQEAESLAAEQGFVTEDEDDKSDQQEESGSGSEDESEEESSEEEEEPRRLMLKPKFVPRSQRGLVHDTEQDEEALGAADEEAKRKAADELVEEQIKKDLAARAAGKKHWDDEDEEDSDVDTTDDVDPEAEEAAWRVRELKRLMRTRAAIEEREGELAEVERRRNLTVEERAAEDQEHLARQREEKESKGSMSYLQKYFHRGAFFREDAEKAGLLQRDIMGSRFQDDVRNREALPQYLQRRDMTKLGRKGASKYRDMKTEDTGQWGRLDGPGGDRERMGGDDRFRPDDDRFKPDERGAKGANAIPLGQRREDTTVSQSRGARDEAHGRRGDDGYGSRRGHGSDRHGSRRDEGRDYERRGSDRYRSTRDEDRDHERRGGDRCRSTRDEDRDSHHGGGQSHSPSPVRQDSHYSSRRKRSTSRDTRGRQEDKRRRVDAKLGR